MILETCFIEGAQYQMTKINRGYKYHFPFQKRKIP